MKSIISISFVFLFSFHISYSQDWKQYPYNPENALISFPKDEGYHQEEKTEWWYTFARLKGKETGTEYTVMFTFFHRDTLVFDGLRIFNISNETTKEFFHDAKPVNYNSNATDHLDIEAEIYGQNRVETWKTKSDSNGTLIPFNYAINAKAPFGSIDLDFDVVKRPLIVADSGFLYQGVKNYTYYYSFTEIDVSGEISLNGITESVEGTAWFDKQYGNFHPEVEEKYEWLSLKLSNGIDINLWEIFNQDFDVPKTPEYKQFNCYINDSTTLNTIDFNIERLDYFYSPDSARIYCRKFLISEPVLDLKIIVEIANPNCEPSFPFNFYEGPLKISGKVAGVDVDGFGFGELLHTYEKPEVEFIYPNDIWNRDSLIRWKVLNPDFGRPLTFDLYSKTPKTEYKLIDKTISDTFYQLNTSDFNQDSLYSFLLISHSANDFFTDSTETGYIRPLSVDEYKMGEIISIYPTLFNQNIIIESKQGVLTGNTHIYILGQDKTVVFDKKIKSATGKIQLNLKYLPDGIYFVNIVKEGEIFSKKIIHVGK